MENKIQNKISIVTGSSRGIGKSIALLLAKSGAKIIVHYTKNIAAAEETLERLGKNGLFSVKADLGNEQEIKSMVDSACTKTSV